LRRRLAGADVSSTPHRAAAAGTRAPRSAAASAIRIRFTFNLHVINIRACDDAGCRPARRPAMASKTERKTARLTLLLDPRKKALFEDICAAQDLTPSQVVRQLIREYIIENAGDRALPSWLLAASRRLARR
jgi:hypothetical protein